MHFCRHFHPQAESKQHSWWGVGGQRGRTCASAAILLSAFFFSAVLAFFSAAAAGSPQGKAVS